MISLHWTHFTHKPSGVSRRSFLGKGALSTFNQAIFSLFYDVTICFNETSTRNSYVQQYFFSKSINHSSFFSLRQCEQLLRLIQTKGIIKYELSPMPTPCSPWTDGEGREVSLFQRPLRTETQATAGPRRFTEKRE